MIKQLVSFFLASVLLCSCTVRLSVCAEDVTPYLQGITDYQLLRSGAENIQDWIDGALSEHAGVSSEWYILALRQSGDYDFSAYRDALTAYLAEHEIYSASARLKYALAFAASGEDTPYISETLETSSGQQGIMSWIYSLHLLNNGYVCESYTASGVTEQLLSMQLEDGGWAVMGTVGDIDVTAMTLQALAVSYPENSAVQEACDRAVTFLADRQMDYGGFQSFGTQNLESTAQVITALSALGIDSASDERFIKNGNSLFQGMDSFRLDDGSYCHTYDGGSNETATVQAFYTFVAYQRMQNGQPPLYILEQSSPEETASVPEEPAPEENPVPIPEEIPAIEIPEIPETLPETEDLIPVQETEQIISTVSETESISSASAMSTVPETTVPQTTDSTASSTTTATESEILSQTSTSSVQTETVTETSGNIVSPVPASSSGNWKKTAYLIILCTGLTACFLLWILKKRNRKNFFCIILLMLTASGTVYLLRIQSPEEYYTQNPIRKENAVGTVTITIRCDTLIGKADSEYIPADGVILDITEIPLAGQETVYDILMQTAQAYGIQTEHNSSYYISGIQYLYEMQYGDLSGWMYRVNGVLPSVGCAEYLLHDGDAIEWLYSCEIGNDLE